MVNKFNYKEEFRTKRRKKLFTKVSFFFVGVIILIVAVFYLLFWGGVFNVRDIKISGLNGAEAVQLKTHAENWLKDGFLFFKRGDNSILLSKDNLNAELLNQFKGLDSLEIKRVSLHNLDIEAIQRKPAGIWCLSDKPPENIRSRCFYFDKNGIAYQEATKSEGFLILNINDKRNREIKIGNKVAPSNWYENILLVKELLSKIKIDISEIVINADSFEDFETKTPAGWRIIFSLSTDIEKQILALNTFLKEKMTPEKIASLIYIDLRIQDRIYYK